MKQICGDCLHYNACAAWNIGSLANADAKNCINFEHIHLYDSVEVVRCKDCKYLNSDIAMGEWEGSCRYWNTHSVMLNDFCSYGERKGGE